MVDDVTGLPVDGTTSEQVIWGVSESLANAR